MKLQSFSYHHRHHHHVENSSNSCLSKKRDFLFAGKKISFLFSTRWRRNLLNLCFRLQNRNKGKTFMADQFKKQYQTRAGTSPLCSSPRQARAYECLVWTTLSLIKLTFEPAANLGPLRLYYFTYLLF